MHDGIATQQTVASEIRGFLSPHVGNLDLNDTDDIFSLGLVNSLFALELVTFVERQFGLRFDLEELKMDNFRSIEAIASLVQREHGDNGHGH